MCGLYAKSREGRIAPDMSGLPEHYGRVTVHSSHVFDHNQKESKLGEITDAMVVGMIWKVPDFKSKPMTVHKVSGAR